MIGGIVVVAAIFGGVMFGVQNCGKRNASGGSAGDVGSTNPTSPTDMMAADSFVQIERLGRPAINEGLVISNAKLLAFNSIPPTLDLATNVPAVLEVLKEASGALDLFDSLDGKNDFKDGFDSEVVAGFLPDVMRIDTAKAIPPGTAGYNGDFVVVQGTNAAMLTGGRKIEDDVADITLSYLVSADPTGKTIKDNVEYAGVAGNPAQGHKKLNGQTNYGGPATFPYLALPY